MNKKSFNEMTYKEKAAQMDSFLDGLQGEDWNKFLIDSEYEFFKNIICPFLDEEFTPVDIYNADKSTLNVDLSRANKPKAINGFIYDYKVIMKATTSASDDYKYKLAA